MSDSLAKTAGRESAHEELHLGTHTGAEPTSLAPMAAAATHLRDSQRATSNTHRKEAMRHL